MLHALLPALLTAIFSSTPAAAPQPVVVLEACQHANDEKPTIASAPKYTDENQTWFEKLVSLNPECLVYVSGDGTIIVNNQGTPLVLPEGPTPSDVTLSCE